MISLCSRVAPYVGAWIETDFKKQALWHCLVAPYVGAWIETESYETYDESTDVAPYVGAWIETIVLAECHVTDGGRTLRGCVD